MATGNAQENKGADVPATEDGLKRIQDALQKQMEYYFSSENLARDKYAIPSSQFCAGSCSISP